PKGGTAGPHGVHQGLGAGSRGGPVSSTTPEKAMVDAAALSSARAKRIAGDIRTVAGWFDRALGHALAAGALRRAARLPRHLVAGTWRAAAHDGRLWLGRDGAALATGDLSRHVGGVTERLFGRRTN